MEIVTIKISKDILQSLVDSDAISSTDFEVKSSDIKDDFFIDDQHYEALKKASIKAYKSLKEYEFNKRNNIKIK